MSKSIAPTQNTLRRPTNQPVPYPFAESIPNSSASYPHAPQQSLAPQPASSQVARRTSGQDSSHPQKPPHTNGDYDVWPSSAENGMQQLSEPAWGSNGDDLDRKALDAKGDAQAKRKQIPPFVQKLSSFLDEYRNTDLIRWSEKGDSFIVIDEDEFARTLIPELFKHKNYASFVRQLNMYGFHKKVGLSDNSMRASERKNKSPSEYYNPYFKRGRPNLLWLIHKPKNPQSRGGVRGNRSRQEDGLNDEDVEEVYDVDQPNHGNQAAVDALNMRQGRQPLMIGNGGTSQDLTVVHEELQAVRKQQQMIAHLLQKTRAEHEQLYGQAANFQKLHDRHESSINAILTFLATVYSRNLEGQSSPDFQGMFHSLSQDGSGQRNMVDVGDYGDQNMRKGQHEGNFRRQPLLLGAPLGDSPKGSVGSPATSVSSRGQPIQDGLHPGHGQAGVTASAPREVSDTPSERSSQSPQIKPETGNNGQPSEADILSMIQSSNAKQPYYNGSRMDFPEALSHLETADGNLPLTANQRNDALRLMASTTGNPSSNKHENALTSPNPPMPNMAQYQQSKDRLDQLSNALKEQGSKVNQLSNVLAPLSPSGSIPGLNEVQNYGDPGANDMLDLDQIFNSGDYFNDAGPGDFNLDSNETLPDFNFDMDDQNANTQQGPSFGFDGVVDDDDKEGSAVETVEGSEGTSPANTVDEHFSKQEDERDTRKRRRKA
ncbi:MAG: hypothetical protein Q9208_004005 [Pyrenodesmia sp. 3 TL-2023]